MKIPKSAIFVAGLSIALFFFTLLIITFTAHQENAAKPKPTEIKPDPILLEYKPNDKTDIILRGYNESKDPNQQITVNEHDYTIYDGKTNKELKYTHWINLDYDQRTVEIKNNKLTLTNFLINTYLNEQIYPFMADEFYVKNEKLYHVSVIIFKPSNIDAKTLRLIKTKMLKYKHRDHTDIKEDEMQDLESMPDDLLILALCGDSEAAKLLKDRTAYDKYFNIELDGSFGEVHSAAEDAYEAYEYLRNQGGSIKEIIPLDGGATR